MILQYQNELLALAAILILLLIYVYIKGKNKTTPEKEEPDVEKAEKIEKTETTQPEEEVKTVPAKQTTQNQPKTKKNVPSHGKITKEDFKIFAGERILLAEDNLINQKVILGVLGDSGIEVVVANDGQEALDILQKDKNFLIILMDAHMPRVDGFEATRTIRKNSQYDDITIVALSGDTASDDIKKMKEAGMDEYLEKPLKVDALYDILYQHSDIPSDTPKEEKTFSDLKTLDTQKGLQISGNDVNFYHDILKEFLSTYSNSAQELETLLKNNKAVQADQLLLDIIGVSANIGADALTESATDIKNNINSNKSVNLTHYSKKLQELTQAINNYFLTCN